MLKLNVFSNENEERSISININEIFHSYLYAVNLLIVTLTRNHPYSRYLEAMSKKISTSKYENCSKIHKT